MELRKPLKEMNPTELLDHLEEMERLHGGKWEKRPNPLTEREREILHEMNEHRKSAGHIRWNPLIARFGLSKNQLVRLSKRFGEQGLLELATAAPKPRLLPNVREVTQSHPLVEGNRMLANYWANLFASKRPDVDFALIQEAADEGLIRAAELYNDKSGTGFSTYASVQIKGKILNVLRKKAKEPEVNLQEKRKGGKSLDESLGSIGQEEEVENRQAAIQMVGKLLEMHKRKELTEKALMVFLLRNYADITLSKVSELMGGTIAGVQALEKRTTDKIKEAFSEWKAR